MLCASARNRVLLKHALRERATPHVTRAQRIATRAPQKTLGLVWSLSSPRHPIVRQQRPETGLVAAVVAAGLWPIGVIFHCHVGAPVEVPLIPPHQQGASLTFRALRARDARDAIRVPDAVMLMFSAVDPLVALGNGQARRATVVGAASIAQTTALDAHERVTGCKTRQSRVPACDRRNRSWRKEPARRRRARPRRGWVAADHGDRGGDVAAADNLHSAIAAVDEPQV